jgi:hypothetical protein
MAPTGFDAEIFLCLQPGGVRSAVLTIKTLRKAMPPRSMPISARVTLRIRVYVYKSDIVPRNLSLALQPSHRRSSCSKRDRPWGWALMKTTGAGAIKLPSRKQCHRLPPFLLMQWNSVPVHLLSHRTCACAREDRHLRATGSRRSCPPVLQCCCREFFFFISFLSATFRPGETRFDYETRWAYHGRRLLWLGMDFVW